MAERQGGGRYFRPRAATVMARGTSNASSRVKPAVAAGGPSPSAASALRLLQGVQQRMAAHLVDLGPRAAYFLGAVRLPLGTALHRNANCLFHSARYFALPGSLLPARHAAATAAVLSLLGQQTAPPRSAQRIMWLN